MSHYYNKQHNETAVSTEKTSRVHVQKNFIVFYDHNNDDYK